MAVNEGVQLAADPIDEAFRLARAAIVGGFGRRRVAGAVASVKARRVRCEVGHGELRLDEGQGDARLSELSGATVRTGRRRLGRMGIGRESAPVRCHRTVRKRR